MIVGGLPSTRAEKVSTALAFARQGAIIKFINSSPGYPMLDETVIQPFVTKKLKLWSRSRKGYVPMQEIPAYVTLNANSFDLKYRAVDERNNLINHIKKWNYGPIPLLTIT